MAIDFNGGASRIVSAEADLLAGSRQITICGWVWIDSAGGLSFGRVIEIGTLGLNSIILFCGGSDSALGAYKACGTTDAEYRWGITPGRWVPFSFAWDFSTVSNPPVNARVDFQNTSINTITTGAGTLGDVAPSYCIGNRSDAVRGFDGGIAGLQIFNRILTPHEQDGCTRVFGSVRRGLRLANPLLGTGSLQDVSGNGFHGIGFELGNRNSHPQQFLQVVPPLPVYERAWMTFPVAGGLPPPFRYMRAA